jgi:hypothetical protein
VAVDFTPELRRKTLDTITLCRQLSAGDTPRDTGFTVPQAAGR